MIVPGRASIKKGRRRAPPARDSRHRIRPRFPSCLSPLPQNATARQHIPLPAQTRAETYLSLAVCACHLREPVEIAYAPVGVQLQVGHIAPGVVEVGGVEPVEGLEPDLERRLAGQRQLAEQPEIPIGIPWSAQCAPQDGDRTGYQMDPSNAREALAELASDLAEGADMLMVKPAGPYLDVLAAARARFDVPLAAYQVSGEYAAICAAAERGWMDRRRAAMESLVGIARAGADVIITYFALEVAGWS